MEIIKSMVKQYYSLLIMLACISFVIWMFFSAGVNGKESVFVGAGKVFAPVFNTGEIKNNGLSYVEESVSGYEPVITYTGGVQTAGTYITLKSMFDVTLEDGTIVKGSEEKDCAIYLMDIKNTAGDSALLFLTAEDIAEMEEIPAPFVYEKEQDILCCFKSGIYTVYLKIYNADGGMETYAFQMPVESS